MSSEQAGEHETRRRPWWIPHFLGAVPAVDDRSLRLLGIIGFAIFFEGYDLSLLVSALPFIARDLAIAETEMGGWTALIRLGGLPAFFLLPFADHSGRRRIFLASICGLSGATLLTAFSSSVEVFASLQMLARVCYITLSATAIVIIAEEFPAKHRGWAIGIFGAMSALGYGFSSILFSMIEVLPGGWRALYAVGALPLLFLPRFRREVPETRRFDAEQRARHESGDEVRGLRAWLEPIRDLATTYPGRMVGVTLACFLFAAAELPVMQFVAYHAIENLGWAPRDWTFMVLTAGMLGLWGNVMAGRLGDRFGRRPIGLVVMTMVPVGGIFFFQAPSWLLWLAWIVLSIGTIAANVMLRALVTESFPTSQRSTAAGWMTLLGSLGASAGLAAVTLLQSGDFELNTSISILSTLALFAGFALFLLPETSGRELEEISEDPHVHT